MPNDNPRIDTLEKEVYDLKIRVAVAESDISTVKQSIQKIDANINKVVWLVLGAIILAVVNLVVKGGV